MKRTADILFLLVLWLAAAACPALAADPAWRTRADFEVSAPGLVEIALPPDLVDACGAGMYDLVLTGPDQQPRAFELYWRDPVERVRHRLNPSAVQLTNQHGFVWEGEADEKIFADQLEVHFAAGSYVGRLDVEGRTPAGWVNLAQNAALFDAGGNRRSRVSITPGRYQKLRLRWAGYDQGGRKNGVPILSVDLLGQIPGKDYVEQRIDVRAALSAMPDGVELELFLPGAGLQVQSIMLQTQASFQGHCEIGRYVILDGRKVFHPDIRSSVARISEEGRRLNLDLGRQWQGRNMVVRLFHGRNFLGRVEKVQVWVRLPRLVFLADSAGTHHLATGLGAGEKTYPHSRIKGPITTPPPAIHSIETNPSWRLAALAEKYQLRGAPFDPAGYTWKSILSIPGPGYYRLPLGPGAALSPHLKGMRLVHRQCQVPFFFGREENRQLTLEAEPRQDLQSNRTVWELQLPYASSRWRALELESDGIFSRPVELLAPKNGSSGWQSLTSRTWEHRVSGRAVLTLALPESCRDRTRLRLVIAHGDNQPIVITRISAHFYAPALFFLAHEKGTYELFGGNPEVSAARYDLSLIQDELMSSLPESIEMADITPVASQGWQQNWTSLFRETRWGFYLTLSLATVTLMVLVTKLFPKPSSGKDQKT